MNTVIKSFRLIALAAIVAVVALPSTASVPAVHMGARRGGATTVELMSRRDNPRP